MVGPVPKMVRKTDADGQPVGDDVIDERQADLLRDTLTRDLSPLERIGLGLKAIHNHPLFERLPPEFRRLLAKL